MAIVLGACSSSRLLYGQLDWLSYRQLNKAFSIRDDQQDVVEARLSLIHQWHRETQLPRYRHTLTSLLERYRRGLKTADLYWLIDEVDLHRVALLNRIAPDLVAFVARIDERQVAHYKQFSQQRLDEAAEVLELTPQERLDERVEEFVDRIEHWTGALNASQLATIRTRLVAIPDYRPLWVAKRRSRRAALLSLLAEPADTRELQGHLERWWQDLRTGYDEAALAARTSAVDETIRLIVDVNRSLDKNQRTHVIERLEGYLRDLDKLAGRQTVQG